MDYKDCLMLKTLSEENSLSRAAEKLFTSQPALSYRISTLEQAFGVKILFRSHRGVRFTPQGNYIKNHALETIKSYEKLKLQLQQTDHFVSGNIKIGFSSVVAKYKMAKIIKGYQIEHQHINIDIEIASSTLKLPLMLKEGKIDLAIVRGNQKLCYPEYLLSEEPMCIAFHKPIEIKQLHQYPYLEYEAADITGSQQSKRKWCQETLGAPPSKIMQVDSLDACMQMASCAMGWCIVPQIHLQSYHLFSLPVQWADGSTMYWKTRLIYHPEISNNNIFQDFLHYILKKYH